MRAHTHTTWTRCCLPVLAGLMLAALFPDPAAALENIGLMGGIDRTKLAGDEPKDFRYESATGFQVGAVVEFGLARNVLLSLQPGYLRTSSDVAYKDKVRHVVRDSLSLDLDWIVLPILARIKSEGGTLYATGGFDLAFRLGGGLSDGTTEEPADTIVRKVDMAALIGVGVELPAGDFRITGELRYRQGLLNTAQKDALGGGDALPARFRFAGFQLLVGLLLPLGGGS